MADKFVFSNFAVASLQSSVDQFDGAMEIHPDDLDRFPDLVTGTKFPIILADEMDNVEICYVTAVTTDGTFSVERGRENTEARSWLAGTTVIHAFTAASVYAGARLTPRGDWDTLSTYGPGDVVLYADISYLAVDENTGQPPSPGSSHWQVLYQPPGAATNSLAWNGEWDSTTTYSIGALASKDGIVWAATAAGTNNPPAFNSGYWEPVALTATRSARYAGVYYSDATANNYKVLETTDKPIPPLYNEMEVTVIVLADNTNTTPTLQMGSGNPPKRIRVRQGIDPVVGAIKANTPYTFVYLTATDEWVPKGDILAEQAIATATAAVNAALASVNSQLASLDARLDALEAWKASVDITLNNMNDSINGLSSVQISHTNSINSLTASSNNYNSRLGTIESTYVRDIDINDAGETALGLGAHVASGYIITNAPYYNGVAIINGTQAPLRKNKGGGWSGVT